MYTAGANRWHDQDTQQRSRMRESCMSGSVRGASSDRRLYSTPRPAAVSRPPLSRSLWLAPPVLTGLPCFGWFPIDLARRNPRECWIPVPFPAPVGFSTNFLRHFRDREKAQLPQAFVAQAWGFASGMLRQIALRMPICLRSLGLGRFTLQAFLSSSSGT
jgi:hypothetical protein